MIEVLHLLHSLEQASTRYSRSYYVRHLDKGETLPDFGHGIPESPLLNREWIWIAFSSKADTPIALIMGAPMQGIAWLMRAYATPYTQTSVFVGLLRKSLADIHSRGYTRYATFLSPSRVEIKIARLIEKAGGTKVDTLEAYHGNTDISKW